MSSDVCVCVFFIPLFPTAASAPFIESPFEARARRWINLPPISTPRPTRPRLVVWQKFQFPLIVVVVAFRPSRRLPLLSNPSCSRACVRKPLAPGATISFAPPEIKLAPAPNVLDIPPPLLSSPSSYTCLDGFFVPFPYSKKEGTWRSLSCVCVCAISGLPLGPGKGRDGRWETKNLYGSWRCCFPGVFSLLLENFGQSPPSHLGDMLCSNSRFFASLSPCLWHCGTLAIRREEEPFLLPLYMNSTRHGGPFPKREREREEEEEGK